MAKEYEVKILDIDVEEIEKKLLELGAKKHEEKFFRIYSYKVDDSSTNVEEHVRLRDEGNKITLAYKKKVNFDIDGTEEIEFEVSSFEKAYEFLSKFTFDGTYYQEKKRYDYVLGDIVFSIDSWPKIPTFLEVESTYEEKVVEGLKLLGLVGKDVGNLSMVKVYNKYGLDIHSFKELKFD